MPKYQLASAKYHFCVRCMERFMFFIDTNIVSKIQCALFKISNMIFFSFNFSVLDSADCAVCEEALQNLEDIDDDADAVGVRMVKTDDSEFAQFMGITEFPAIVYYENGNPHIYDGDAREESELLTWILYQMKEDTIENINRDLLMKMILDYEYLGVFFCKSQFWENSIRNWQ